MESKKPIFRLAIAAILCTPTPGLAETETDAVPWDCRTAPDGVSWDCQPLPPASEATSPVTQAPVAITPLSETATTPEPPRSKQAGTAADIPISLGEAYVADENSELVRVDPEPLWSQCGPQQELYVAGAPKAPLPPREDALINLSADHTEGNIEEQVTFRGNVVVQRSDQQLRSDRVSFDRRENRLTAEGDIFYRDEGLSFTAETAELDFERDHGVLTDVEYRLGKRHGRGRAKRADLEGRDISRYKKVTYTTCNPGKRDWELRARRLTLDRAKGVGKGRGVTLRFKNVPFLYTPYLYFPIDDRRKSGFLAPSFGRTDETGVDITTPYYWNIAPNYDATLIPRYMDQRGLMLGGEFRYLTQKHHGELALEFLPDDDLRGDDRGALSLQHNGTITNRLRTDVDFNYVSDREYFEDFGNSLSLSSIRQLERRGDLRYHGGFWNLLGRLQYFQPVDRNLTTAERSYSRLPQLLLTGRLPNQRFGLDYQLHSEYAYFDRNDSVIGNRLDLYPSISRPFLTPGTFFTPKFSLRYTQYYLDNVTSGNPDKPSRITPIVSVDSGLFLEREAQWRSTPLLHTLEPRLFYLYVEDEDQSDIPLFDSIGLDFNFAQLFRENRFSGADRLGDANQLTAALTSRLLNSDNGRELLRASFGEIFFFRDREVTLSGQEPDIESLSNLVVELGSRIAPTITARATYQWDPDKRRGERATILARYLRDQDHILNVAYRFRRKELEQTDLSVRWPIARNWFGVGRWNYSIRDNTSLETFVGLEYESCCWLFRAMFRQYVNGVDLDEKTDALMFQLVLKGLTAFGDKVEDLLEEGILGYTAESN